MGGDGGSGAGSSAPAAKVGGGGSSSSSAAAVEEEHELVPQLRFPPGHYFQPTDVELVDVYLRAKVEGRKLPLDVVNEVVLLDWQPAKLVEKSKAYGRDRWFFFTRKDERSSSSKKDPEPRRQLRPAAGVAATWKSSGSLTIIRRPRSREVIGSKRFLIYGTGEGEDNGKWTMHEYAMGETPKMDEYVLCSIQIKLHWDKDEEDKVATDGNESTKVEEKDREEKVASCGNKRKSGGNKSKKGGKKDREEKVASGHNKRKKEEKKEQQQQQQQQQQQKTILEQGQQQQQQQLGFDGMSHPYLYEPQTQDEQEQDMMIIPYPCNFHEQEGQQQQQQLAFNGMSHPYLYDPQMPEEQEHGMKMLPYSYNFQEQGQQQQQQQLGFDGMSHPYLHEPQMQEEQEQNMTMLSYLYNFQEQEQQQQQQLGSNGISHQYLYESQMPEEQQQLATLNGSMEPVMITPIEQQGRNDPYGDHQQQQQQLPFSTHDTQLYEEQQNGSACAELGLSYYDPWETRPLDLALSTWEEMPSIDRSVFVGGYAQCRR